MKKLPLYIAFWLLLIVSTLNGQNLITINIVPDRPNWTYSINDSVKFTVTVLKFMSPLTNSEITYRIGPERMAPIRCGNSRLKNGSVTLVAAPHGRPGMLTCEVIVKYEGKEYKEWSSVAVSPESIRPTTTLPPDFQQFWDSTLQVLAEIPLETKIERVPRYCNDKAEVYQVSFRNLKGRIYGYAAIPKKEGRYPVLLYLPWAGVYAAEPETEAAERGVITFTFNIHGLPNNLDKQVYTDLAEGALNNYPFINLDNRNHYYLRNAYTAGIRAIDFLTSLPQYDGKNLGVIGLSQGGGLSIITASLDKRVKFLSCTYPALCDLTGYLEQRAGGWPHMFTGFHSATPERIATSKYYDAVNFARFITIPGIYSWGYNDNVCPPTSMFSAFNVISGQKSLHIFQDRKHNSYAEQRELMLDWIIDRLQSH